MSKEGASVLYSLSLSSIGRTTHTVGSAGAHMRYILRSSAVAGIVGRGIPANAAEAAAWMDAQELGDRANARVCDGVILALPHQLTHEQRKTLLRDWCDDVSVGVPYVAALHKPSQEGDERNHHAHVVFRDRDPTTGKRAMMSSEKGFADRMRTGWERHVNAALEAAGSDERTDCRSLAARGIERTPQLHVGPAATAAARRAGRDDGKAAERPRTAQPLRSMPLTVRNGPGARSRTRDVDYPTIDGRRTRAEENERRMAANLAGDRAQARAAMEARLAQARATMTGMGLSARPAQQPATTRAAPARMHAGVAAATAMPAPETARPSKALALAMERTLQPMPPRLAEPALPARTPAPAIPERAIAAEQETPAARAARKIAEGEEWLAGERAAGRHMPAAQTTAAPATPPLEIATAQQPPPRAATPPGQSLMSAARSTGQAAASGIGRVTRLAAAALNALRAATPSPAPAAPAPKTEAPAPPRARDYSGAVQDVTTRRSDGTVRFYTTAAEQRGDDGGLGGLERTLRQAGVTVERKALYEDTDEGGRARSWLSLTCQRYNLEQAVRRMGDAGADLVERLSLATAASTRHVQAHIRPWRDRLKAERDRMKAEQAEQKATSPRPPPKRDGTGIAD
jgi:hypothetical protein